MAAAGGAGAFRAGAAVVQYPLPAPALKPMLFDFRHPHFAEPGWLWLAVLGPVCLFLLHRYAGAVRKRQLSGFAAPGMLAQALGSHSPLRRAVKNTLLIAAVAGIGLALARPQWGETTEVTQSYGEDVL